MIASLKGTVDAINSSHAIIDIDGVGYKVLLTGSILLKLSIGDKVKVFTYTHVREDVLELYGFLSQEELRLFEYLIGVSGVGPKTALCVFSYGSKEEIVEAVTTADVDFFTAVPRLGKKNAQRIIIELKGKLGSITDLDLSGQNSKENDEVVAALKNFGFSATEAKEALKNIRDKDVSTEEKIRLALKYLGKQ